MNSNRPYLLRAFYEWIVDNHLTPYIVVNADLPGVDVPRDYVEDGRIVLNISPSAIQHLNLDNSHVTFNARFSGKPFDIYIPIRAIGAIYAKENGRGMVFKEEDLEESDEGETTTAPTVVSTTSGSGEKPKGKSGQRPNLTIVK